MMPSSPGKPTNPLFKFCGIPGIPQHGLALMNSVPPDPVWIASASKYIMHINLFKFSPQVYKAGTLYPPFTDGKLRHRDVR